MSKCLQTQDSARNILAGLVCNLLCTKISTKLVDGIFKLEEDRLNLCNEGLYLIESSSIQIVDSIGQVGEASLGVKEEFIGLKTRCNFMTIVRFAKMHAEQNAYQLSLHYSIAR